MPPPPGEGVGGADTFSPVPKLQVYSLGCVPTAVSQFCSKVVVVVSIPISSTTYVGCGSKFAQSRVMLESVQ